MISRARFLRGSAALAGLSVAPWVRSATPEVSKAAGASGAPSASTEPDLSVEQRGRPRSAPVPEAQRLVPAGFRFAREGVLTVGTTTGRLPVAAFALDDRTPVGNAPDIAQLVADSLGRRLELVSVVWTDWPLGLASGRFDAVISNITITEERKRKFDFSSYRQDLLGFYVPRSSPIQAIREPRDVAGLRVIVGASTSQEQILLRWNQQNIAAGLKPVQIQYHEDDVVLYLALASGRADVYFAPNGIAAYHARDGRTRLVGTLPGGWPQTAEIGAATRKGSGLAEAVTAALNAQIRSGNYLRALQRWNLQSEAVTQARTNPPGLAL